MDFELPPDVIAIACQKKLNANACQYILDLMSEITKIDGVYAYDNRGDMTLLYIDPQDKIYINDEDEYVTVTKFFSKVMMKIVDQFGADVWE